MLVDVPTSSPLTTRPIAKRPAKSRCIRNVRKATKYRDRDEPNKLAWRVAESDFPNRRSSLRSRHHGPDVGNLLVLETVLEEEQGIGFRQQYRLG